MRSDMPKWLQTLFGVLLAAGVAYEITKYSVAQYRGCTGERTQYHLLSGDCFIVTHQPSIYTRKELP